MIWVVKKLLMMLNKNKIKVKDKVLMGVHLISGVVVLEVVVLKVLILKIYLQVHLVEEEEVNVDNKEVEEVEEDNKIIFILKMMIKMIFNMEDKNKENKLI